MNTNWVACDSDSEEGVEGEDSEEGKEGAESQNEHGADWDS